MSRKEYDENVLGIIRDEVDETIVEDPIELYRRRKMAKSDAMYIWTKSHYEILRKQQTSPSQVKSQIIRKQLGPLIDPNYILAVMISAYLLMRLYMYIHKSTLLDGK